MTTRAELVSILNQYDKEKTLWRRLSDAFWVAHRSRSVAMSAVAVLIEGLDDDSTISTAMTDNFRALHVLHQGGGGEATQAAFRRILAIIPIHVVLSRPMPESMLEPLHVPPLVAQRPHSPTFFQDAIAQGGFNTTSLLETEICSDQCLESSPDTVIDSNQLQHQGLVVSQLGTISICNLPPEVITFR